LGTYVGGGASYSKRDFKLQSLHEARDDILQQFAFTTVEQGPVTTEDTGIGYWATLGYRATAHWAFEGSYSKLSTLKYKSSAEGYSTLPVLGTPPIATFPGSSVIKFDIEDNTLQLDALFIIPRGYRWEFYGRGGLLFGSSKSEIRLDNPGVASGKGSSSDSYTSYHAGVGFTFSMLEVYGLRLEYDHAFAVGADSNQLNEKHDVDSITLGVIVAF
jgi:hypothetical protein